MKKRERERESGKDGTEKKVGKDERRGTKLSKWSIGRQHLQDAFGRFVPGVLIQRGSCRVRNISQRESKK